MAAPMSDAGDDRALSASPAPSELSDIDLVPDEYVVQGVAPNNHLLLVPIAGTVRQLYRSVTSSYAEVLNQFVTGRRDSTTLRQQCQSFISLILKVGFHQDLVNEEAMSQISDGSVSPSQQANWDRTVCAKLRFLDSVITQLSLRGKNANVGVLATDRDALKLIKTFLRGSVVDFHEAGDVAPPEAEDVEDGADDVKVTLLVGGEMKWISQDISLVVSINYDYEKEAAAIRNLNQSWERLYPQVPLPTVVSLVPCYSGEHIARCLPTDVDELVRLRSFVSSIAHYRARAGTLPHGYPRVDTLAEEVVRYLFLSDAKERGAGEDADKEIVDPFISYAQLPTIQVFKSDASSTSAKRALSPSLEEVPLSVGKKRPRLYADQDIEWDSPTAIGTQISAGSAASSNSDSRVLFERIADLTRCLESVQDAFEHRSQSYRDLRRENKKLMAKNESLKEKWCTMRDKLSERSTDLRTAQLELHDLRQSIAAGRAVQGLEETEPTPAPLVTQLQQSLLLSKEETEKALARLQSRSDELDAIRAVYQNMSARNRELIGENSKLTAKVSSLTTKLSHRANVVEAESISYLPPGSVDASSAAGLVPVIEPSGADSLFTPNMTTLTNVTSPTTDIGSLHGSVPTTAALPPVPLDNLFLVPAEETIETVSGDGLLPSIPVTSAPAETIPPALLFQPPSPRIRSSVPNPIALTQRARLERAESDADRLRSQVSSLEALLEAKEEELRRIALRNPRMSARASTPRSPRVGRNGADGSVFGSSRAQSPAGRLGVVRGQM